MNLKITSACCAAVLLSACGGSGSSGSASFTELLNEFEDLEGREYEVTASADLPPGSAKFSGVAIAAQEDAVTEETIFGALGEASIAVDFDEGEISGAATNFFQFKDLEIDDIEDAEGTAINGRLDFELTEIVDGANAFAGETTGRLTDTDGTNINFAMDAEAAFFGDAAEAVSVFGSEGTKFFAIMALQD